MGVLLINTGHPISAVAPTVLEARSLHPVAMAHPTLVLLRQVMGAFKETTDVHPTLMGHLRVGMDSAAEIHSAPLTLTAPHPMVVDSGETEVRRVAMDLTEEEETGEGHPTRMGLRRLVAQGQMAEGLMGDLLILTDLHHPETVETEVSEVIVQTVGHLILTERQILVTEEGVTMASGVRMADPRVATALLPVATVVVSVDQVQ